MVLGVHQVLEGKSFLSCNTFQIWEIAESSLTAVLPTNARLHSFSKQHPSVPGHGVEENQNIDDDCCRRDPVSRSTISLVGAVQFVTEDHPIDLLE